MEMTCCCTRVLDQGHPAAGIHYSKQSFSFCPKIQGTAKNGKGKHFLISHHITAICVTFIEASPDSLLKAKI